LKSSIRSWNCPWTSPQTVTGQETAWQATLMRVGCNRALNRQGVVFFLICELAILPPAHCSPLTGSPWLSRKALSPGSEKVKYRTPTTELLTFCPSLMLISVYLIFWELFALHQLFNPTFQLSHRLLLISHGGHFLHFCNCIRWTLGIYLSQGMFFSPQIWDIWGTWKYLASHSINLQIFWFPSNPMTVCKFQISTQQRLHREFITEVNNPIANWWCMHYLGEYKVKQRDNNMPKQGCKFS